MDAADGILEKYLNRFDELIVKAQKLLDESYEIAGDILSQNLLTGETRRGPNKQVVEWRDFVQWRTSCVALISQLISEPHPLRDSISTFQNIKNLKSYVEWGLATLSAVRDDLEKGDLMSRAESAVAVDYMDQAEALLKDNSRNSHSHIAAALLAGVVLEKQLRRLYGQASQGQGAKTNPKTLGPLIDELKKSVWAG